MARSVGVVVPAYQPNVDRLSRYVRALDDRLNPTELRIELDDPSPGDEEALADLPATVHVAAQRRGKGAAITEGFDALSTDVLAFADADGSTPADSVAKVIEPVAAGAFDLAAGSRRHPEADVQSHQKTLRRLLGDGFAWLARQLLDPDLHDYQCGAKAMSANFWARLRRHLTEPGFAWDIELLAVAGALGGKITEVPVVWEDKPESTVDPVSDTLSMFTGLLAARHRAKAVRGSWLHERFAAWRDRPHLIERGAQ